MDSFVLLAYASLAASRAFLQRLLTCQLYSIFRRFILLVQVKEVISMNYWQQHMQLKTMETSEVSPDTYMGDIYIIPT